MKLITSLFLSLFISAILSAQVVIDPDIILFEVTGESMEVKIDVTNNTNEFTEVFWMLEKGENYRDEWDITICDAVICYGANKFKSSASLPNPLDPDQKMFFKFTITSNGVEGSSYGILHLYSDSKCENEIAISKPPITSVSNETIKSIVIYPNPASDYFQIKSDASVKYLEVSSITGKILLSEKHLEDKMYDISQLPNGVFFVILRDENGEKIKTLRLLK